MELRRKGMTTEKVKGIDGAGKACDGIVDD